MNNEQLISRIEINPSILNGKPVIKGTRLSVQFILGLLASEAAFNEILLEYSGLSNEDILACLLFASNTLENSTFVPLSQNTI